jgi:hypothetical protein
MIFPFQVTLVRAFTLAEMQLWAENTRPECIEMTDRQYKHYAELCTKNKKDFNGIPIVFLDTPQPAV